MNIVATAPMTTANVARRQPVRVELDRVEYCMAVPHRAAPTRFGVLNAQYVDAPAVRSPPDGGVERGIDPFPRPAGSLWTAGEAGPVVPAPQPDSPTASPTT